MKNEECEGCDENISTTEGLRSKSSANFTKLKESRVNAKNAKKILFPKNSLKSTCVQVPQDKYFCAINVILKVEQRNNQKCTRK